MVEVDNPDFCIGQVADSGQCFRIKKLDSTTWQVLALGKLLKIKKINNIHVFDCSADEYEGTWHNYFDFDRDYGAIKDSVRKLHDPYLTKAVEYGFGIRILRQDIWETTVSFIISQRNSIRRIKNIIEKLCESYDGMFPGPDILAKHDEKFFRNFGLGYRAKYILDIARAADSGTFDMQHLKTLDLPAATAYLRRFNGIGEKVANCVALYSLHHLDAFPVDTWINRIIHGQYHGNFNIEHFCGHSGIVQQYMFFYQRSLQTTLLPNKRHSVRPSC
jgi:N-glycosylase/DNA lyase